MTQPAQTSAEARRRPLVQYVILNVGPGCFRVESSSAGSKPSHWMIHRPDLVGNALTIERARELVPAGYKRLDRRKDDRADVVEVWV